MPNHLVNRLRGHAAGFALGVLLGAAAGVALYYLFRLDGVLAAALLGAGAGLVGAFAIRLLHDTVSITNVTLNIPQFSTVTFEVTDDRRGLAERILLQLTSRIAIQRLDEDAGYARETLNSLYFLFTWVRDELLADPGPRLHRNANVNVLAMNMLNEQLRPFLSRWHRRLGDWENANEGVPDSQWPQDAEFRAELAELQRRLHPIAVGFAELAGVADYTDYIGLGPDQAPPPRSKSTVIRRPALALAA